MSPLIASIALTLAYVAGMATVATLVMLAGSAGRAYDDRRRDRLEVTTLHRDHNGDIHIARRDVEHPADAAERILREES